MNKYILIEAQREDGSEREYRILLPDGVEPDSENEEHNIAMSAIATGLELLSGGTAQNVKDVRWSVGMVCYNAEDSLAALREIEDEYPECEECSFSGLLEE